MNNKQTTFDFNDGNGPVPAHKHPNGGGWVAETAKVEPSVYIGPNALVFGNATVSGKAQVSGNAHVSEKAKVFGNATVYGNAKVSGNAYVSENAQVSGNAHVSGNAQVTEDAHVSGDAKVSGDACVCKNTNITKPLVIPKIKNIDSKILKAVSSDGCSLNMDDWHSCETTHCRAGWAIHLAGKKGYDLEKMVGSAEAGKLIYEKSRPGRKAPNFYSTNENAMRSIRRDAKKEKSKV